MHILKFANSSAFGQTVKGKVKYEIGKLRHGKSLLRVIPNWCENFNYWYSILIIDILKDKTVVQKDGE